MLSGDDDSASDDAGASGSAMSVTTVNRYVKKFYQTRHETLVRTQKII